MADSSDNSLKDVIEIKVEALDKPAKLDNIFDLHLLISHMMNMNVSLLEIIQSIDVEGKQIEEIRAVLKRSRSIAEGMQAAYQKVIDAVEKKG